MTPERWREVEAVYQSVIERAPDSRSAYLAEACGNDEGLRREVESLLKLNSSPALIDQPVWQAAGELLDNGSNMAAGTQLGPYRIEGVLGAGGMGQVYRARDTRLDRQVAIKVSKEEFNERFEREARAVAALNHPNICTLHDVGPNYLVMELVEGPTLAERIREGPIPLEEALAIVRQIADALEAAHERGIIHRDLKPGNIKIKSDGTMKVLDFGLAKRRTVEGAADLKPEDSPTISAAATRAGVILGTAAYMSPEQARGHAVDKRADIWAFGVVLYEMLAGEQLFEGTTITDTLASVLTKEPDWSKAPSDVRGLLQACLEKDPKRRLHDIADAWRLVEQAPVTKPALSKLPWAVAFVLAVIAAIALWGWRHTQKTSEKPLVRLPVDLGSNMPLGAGGPGRHAVLSPDDTRLAFVSRMRIFTRRLDQSETVELAGTEGAYFPFFSPDGQWIAFFALGRLKKISVDGGPTVPLCDAEGTEGGDWAADGQIIASIGGVLSLIPADGGGPSPVTKLAAGEAGHNLPQFLPDGKSVLFIVATDSGSSSAEVLSLKDGRRKTVQPGATFARYLSNGRLIYISRDTLYAARFDLDRLEVRGTPAAILLDVFPNLIEVSPAGTLIYRDYRTTLTSRTVQWLESNGKMQPVLAKPDYYGRPRLSPDGQRLALQLGVGPTSRISIYEFQQERVIPLPVRGVYPVWSPDGRYIIFLDRDGISWTPSDGSGKPQRLIGRGNRRAPSSFTADGKRLAFYELNSVTEGYDLWTVPVQAETSGLRAGQPEVLLQTPFDERHPAFSPDGRWLAYSSNDSGSFQIYVQPFSGTSATGPRVRISSNGGVLPIWSRTRPELFFRTEEDNRVMVVSYKIQNGSFLAEKPRRWSEKRLAGGSAAIGNYDLAPDGRRLIALMPTEEQEDTSDHHLTFLINFADEVRRRTQ